MPLKGYFSATAHFKNESKQCKFYVTEGNSGNLLGYSTATDLGVIQVVREISELPESLSEFKELFNGGIGKVKNKTVKLHIDESVKPKIQPHRRQPFHSRKDIEDEVERLDRLDIIEDVYGPTPWVSPIVTVPKKSGGIRICVDMREANKAIQRERHVIPTLDDLVNDLNGATVFSTLDLSSAYHQLELAPESRYITTFSTHLGLKRYKRLFFGINAASEIFQNAIAEILHDLPGCKNISDDIIVHGKDRKEHDRNLRAVLKRLKEHGVTLNLPKCHFYQSQVKFYGHIFSAEGIKPDPKKIQSIVDAPAPLDVSGVKSLLGMAQYLARFIPDYAHITAPLRELTRNDVKWEWNHTHDDALNDLKKALTGARVMAYFNPK
ncbi:MAG: RNA-directed DNA polymerase, partial [Candidatus Omnitrophica bacterium]|nr:RNA-directed DNA polymerase [Candidatus Omnitrophota bacterium]